MELSTIEQIFPTFTPWGRRLLASAGRLRRSAVAAVGRARRRVVVRLSLRDLMILVLGGGLGWLVRRAHSQRDAVTAVRRAGSAWYDWQLKDGRPDPDFPRMWPAPERPRQHMMKAEWDSTTHG
jgi:hypothetical protein